MLQVWVVSWELPDKSWEAICLSEATADSMLREKEADSLIAKWGNAKRLGPSSLLEWYSSHVHPSSTDVQACADVVTQVLKQSEESTQEPVVLRTW